MLQLRPDLADRLPRPRRSVLRCELDAPECSFSFRLKFGELVLGGCECALLECELAAELVPLSSAPASAEAGKPRLRCQDPALRPVA